MEANYFWKKKFFGRKTGGTGFGFTCNIFSQKPSKGTRRLIPNPQILLEQHETMEKPNALRQTFPWLLLYCCTSEKFGNYWPAFLFTTTVDHSTQTVIIKIKKWRTMRKEKKRNEKRPTLSGRCVCLLPKSLHRRNGLSLCRTRRIRRQRSGTSTGIGRRHCRIATSNTKIGITNEMYHKVFSDD